MLSGNRDDNRGMAKIVPPEGLLCSVLRDFQAHLEFREHGFTVRVISRTPARTLPDFHGGYPCKPGSCRTRVPEVLPIGREPWLRYAKLLARRRRG